MSAKLILRKRKFNPCAPSKSKSLLQSSSELSNAKEETAEAGRGTAATSTQCGSAGLKIRMWTP